jgi:hypothetical protein
MSRDAMQRFSRAKGALAHQEIGGVAVHSLHEGRELRQLYWDLTEPAAAMMWAAGSCDISLISLGYD